MGQSLKARFNGESQEVLEYARQFGIWKTMEQYKVKDYISMSNFLQDMAPGESFNESSEGYDAFSDTDTRAFDNLVSATQRYISRLENRLTAEIAKNKQLEQALEADKKVRWNQRRPLIENLRMQINKENIDF